MKIISPIIREYLSTGEDRDTIIRKYTNKNQYLESILLRLNEEMTLRNEINKDLSNAIDKAIIKGHPDSNLFVLFIATVISYYSRNFQLEKANSLCSIIDSMLSEEIHPIIRANFLQRKSAVKFREGNIKESFQLMNESLLLFDKSHPRYNIYFYNWSAFIASVGQLKEFGKYQLDQFNFSSDKKQPRSICHIKMVNCIFTCDLKEGKELLNEGATKIEGINEEYQYFSNLISLLNGEFEETKYTDPKFQVLAKIYQCLSENKIEIAKANFQKVISEIHSKFYINRYLDYLPLQFELCSKKTGLAKLLFQDKSKKGALLYLDDLYLGRIQLLENDLAGADESFSRLTENINRYDAKNRLIFELQFAKEMKWSNIIRLLDGWKSENTEKSLNQKLEAHPKQIQIEKGINLLIGRGSAISTVKELVKKYANLKSPILVTGETGTGKELVSRAIHDEGRNANEPFLAINCGALTDTLLQSELFGYEAGAFTGAQKERIGIFEAAGNGTVFLDEFGDISPKLQVSLLRVLESNEIRLIGGTSNRQIKCKIVIATNVDLHQAVVDKKFREDLFFRMSKFEIKIPALRERIEDIAELIEYFLKLCSNESGQTKSVSNELLQELVRYRWPGNIRELKNEIDRLYILNPESNVLNLEHFDFTHLQNYNSSESSSSQESISAEIKNEVDEIKADPILNMIHKGFRIEHRQKTLLELFKKYKKLTRTQIMNITKVSSTTTSKDLELLVEKGVIILRTPTQSTSTNYFEFLKEI